MRRPRAVIFIVMACVAAIMFISGCSDEAVTASEGKSVEYWQERDQYTTPGPNGNECEKGPASSISLSPSVSSNATGIEVEGWGTERVKLTFAASDPVVLNLIAGDTTTGDERRGLFGGGFTASLGHSVSLSIDDFNEGQLEYTSIRKIDWMTICAQAAY